MSIYGGRSIWRRKWKEFGERRNRERSWITFTQTWGNRTQGRYWKRQLSKARRRYIKAQLRGIRMRQPTGIESEVNWKGW